MFSLFKRLYFKQQLLNIFFHNNKQTQVTFTKRKFGSKYNQAFKNIRFLNLNKTYIKLLYTFSYFHQKPIFAGHFHQEEVRPDEEGVRAVCAVRLRDRPDHLQRVQQAVPVRVHGHGQGAAEVHRVQRAAREQNQHRHHRGLKKYIYTAIILFKILEHK